MLPVLSTLGQNVGGSLALLGGITVMLCYATDYSYSNLNTYVISYMRVNGYGNELTYADFVYVASSKAILQGLSMPFVGMISRKVGVRISLILGAIIYGVGWSLTYFTVKIPSLPLVVISFGCTHGIGFSFVYATCIGVAQKWFSPKVKGLVGSIVVSGYGFGSLVWIPIQTSFVNPDNLNATSVNGSDDKYYTDEEVLDRVPYLFLLMGGSFLVLVFLSAFVIQDPSPEKLAEIQGTASDDSTTKAKFNVSPRDVLKTSEFYKIWIGFFAVSLCQGLLVNFQKNFGLLLVNSDYYHATVGIIVNIFNGGCRPVWGLIYDKFGYRICMIVISASVCLGVALLPTLSYLEEDSMTVKACYAILLIVIYTTFPGIYPTMAAAVADAYGPEHYRANFGLLFSQTAAYSILIVVIAQVESIFNGLGYGGMFWISSGICLTSLIVSFFTPKFLDSEKFRSRFEKTTSP